MNVEPCMVRLQHRPPRVVQVCVCGAVLIRGTHREQAFYFWSALADPEPQARVFRSEDKAGIHCGRDLCRPPPYLLGCDLEEMQRQGFFREPGWWRSQEQSA